MSQTSGVDEYRQKAEQVAGLLKDADRIQIISHCSPDGDTLGSAFALCGALQRLGKSTKVVCSDPIPEKYNFLKNSIRETEFTPELNVAVDLASVNLFGEKYAELADNVEICIDHHPSNSRYAKTLLLRPQAAATCEIIKDVIILLGVEIDNNIAECIYTGLATDTGCFRFSNTTPNTLRCAAEMVEKGADSAGINKAMFETVTRQRLEIEREALNTLEYYFDGRVAVIFITLDMCKRSGVLEDDLEGIPSIPVRISGVLAGITIKEKKPGFFKISIRTNSGVNASLICSTFGGGGHAAAAGCQLQGSLEKVKEKVVNEVGKAILNQQ